MPKPIVLTHLPEDLARFAEAQVAAGRFPDVEGVVEAGLLAMKRYTEKASALDAALEEGERSGLFEGDPFASVRAELGLPPR
jgi:putative addiction module CopG family antidote